MFTRWLKVILVVLIIIGGGSLVFDWWDWAPPQETVERATRPSS